MARWDYQWNIEGGGPDSQCTVKKGAMEQFSPNDISMPHGLSSQFERSPWPGQEP